MATSIPQTGPEKAYPGVRVPLFQRFLHLHVTGRGEVTVILEPDLEAGSLAWSNVATALAASMRVVRYDRAGYGWSDPAPGRPSVRDAAQDLYIALKNQGLTGPYVLVGNGYGAGVMRVFAARYRREVAGLVLFAARHESFEALAPRSWRQREDRVKGRLLLAAALAQLGMIGAAYSLIGSDVARHSAEDECLFIRQNFNHLALAARYKETAASVGYEAELKASEGALSDLPLIVVSHRPSGLFRALQPAEAARAEEVWQGFQARLAASATRGELRLVEGGTGYLPGEHSAAVVRAVEDVIQSAGE